MPSIFCFYPIIKKVIKRSFGVFKGKAIISFQIKLPLFLHQRDAHSDFFPLLSKYRPNIVGGVVHCFTADKKALDAYLDIEMHIGITGWICDERRGRGLQEIVRRIPESKLLLETDSPYLLPRSIRPKPKSRRNEPKFLPEVARLVSEHSQKKLNEIAHITTLNAKALFNLPVENIDS